MTGVANRFTRLAGNFFARIATMVSCKFRLEVQEEPIERKQRTVIARTGTGGTSLLTGRSCRFTGFTSRRFTRSTTTNDVESSEHSSFSSRGNRENSNRSQHRQKDLTFHHNSPYTVFGETKILLATNAVFFLSTCIG
jgi:hypothetical protein